MAEGIQNTTLARATARMAVSRPLASVVFHYRDITGDADMSKKQRGGDWRLIENEKEKYAAYLCSREWSVKKEAVKERSRGICERCNVLPGNAVHHLTYERKYNESIEDLQNNCNACHDFTHAKSDFDPSRYYVVLRWLTTVANHGNRPIPVEFLYELADPNNRIQTCFQLNRAVDFVCSVAVDLCCDEQLCTGTIVDVRSFISDLAGFDIPDRHTLGSLKRISPQEYAAACKIVRVPCEALERDICKYDDDGEDFA